MIKIASEGYPFIGTFSALTVLAYFIFGLWIALLPLCGTLFMVYFFRDPERQPPETEGFLCPADGRVIAIKPIYEGEYLKSNALMISIFMSPFDVHVNRSPCNGEVVEVKHTPGSFKAAYQDDASLKNENTAMLIRCGEVSVLVRQVAGFLARRVVCKVEPGSRLKRGDRFGMIKFSSRLDVYLPENVQVKVKLNEKVRAGETVLASL
jgi:phosphatidylserine decarboxylase